MAVLRSCILDFQGLGDPMLIVAHNLAAELLGLTSRRQEAYAALFSSPVSGITYSYVNSVDIGKHDNNPQRFVLKRVTKNEVVLMSTQ